MPTWFDWLLFALAVPGLALRAWTGMRTLNAAEPAEVAALRPRFWWRAIVTQWTLAAVTVAWWIAARRDFAALGLVPRPTWGLGGVLAGAVLISFALASQRRQVAADPALAERVRRRVAAVARLLPHGPAEWPGFATLAVTAGICEELIFRGFVTWHLSHLLPWWWAAALGQVALFGLAHAYQGARGVLATGFAGLFFTLVVAVTGSLWAAMLMHAMVDLHSGALAARVLAPERPAAK